MSTPALLWGSMGPDSHALDVGLEQAVGKTQSLVHLAEPWSFGGTPQPFPDAMLQSAYDRGSLVLLDWASWDLQHQADPAYSLDSITGGQHDAYLHAWAQAAAAWQHPFMLRVDAEMNGAWEPYGAQPAKFVAAWQHVHDLFKADGATNATWCWCPNIVAPKGSGAKQSTAEELLPLYYPGDGYVDWTGCDGYNWFVGKSAPWQTLSQVLAGFPGWVGNTYGVIQQIAPSKPMVLAEWGCWDSPLKAAWMLDALASLPVRFPQIRAISYFNWNAGTAKAWPLGGDSLAAFGNAIASPIWLPAGVWQPEDGKPFGAPPLVLEPQRPGIAQDLAAAQAQMARDAQAMGDLRSTLVLANQALADTIAQRQGIRANLRALVDEAGTQSEGA